MLDVATAYGATVGDEPPAVKFELGSEFVNVLQSRYVVTLPLACLATLAGIFWRLTCAAGGSVVLGSGDTWPVP